MLALGAECSEFEPMYGTAEKDLVSSQCQFQVNVRIQAAHIFYFGKQFCFHGILPHNQLGNHLLNIFAVRFFDINRVFRDCKQRRCSDADWCSEQHKREVLSECQWGSQYWPSIWGGAGLGDVSRESILPDGFLNRISS